MANTDDINEEIVALLKEILELDELSPARLEQFKNCDYLLIMDMGCGNTSMALLDLKHYREKTEPISSFLYVVGWDYSDISIVTGDQFEAIGQVSIPTIAGYRSSREFYVGPQALTMGNSVENFKACPNEQNLNECVLKIQNYDGSATPIRLRDVWTDYFNEILNMSYEKMKVPNKELDLEGNTLVMVAHPAGLEWSQSAVLANFRGLIAGGNRIPDERILTVSEAKAAMQFVRRKNGITLDFKKGVIIIDIGASTIDIEYLSSGTTTPIEFSITMAGRDVDRLLGHYVLEKIYPAEMRHYPQDDQIPDEEFFTERDTTLSNFRYNMRSWKELVSDYGRDPASAGGTYTISVGEQTTTVTASELRGLLGDATNDPLNGVVNGTRKISAAYELPMALFVSQDQENYRAVQQVEATWYAHLENIIRYVLTVLAEDGKYPAQIIVTGGSCRLLGIQDHVRAAVKDSPHGDSLVRDNKIIYLDSATDYENAVPFGGGYYVGGLLKHIDELLSFPDKLAKTLKPELAKVASERIAEAVDGIAWKATENALTWWAGLEDNDKNCSTDALHEQIRSNVKNALDKETQNAVNKALKGLQSKDIPETMKEIKALLENLAGTEFTGTPQLRAICINLDPKSIQSYIELINPEGLVGFFNGLLQNIFAKIKHQNVNQIPRKSKYRTEALATYQHTERPAISPQFAVDVQNLLQNKFDKTGIFGIPNQIIRDLRKDISRALYLS